MSELEKYIDQVIEDFQKRRKQYLDALKNIKKELDTLSKIRKVIQKND